MDPSRPNRILEDWNAIANEARRPAAPPRPVVVRSGLPGATLAGASLVVVGLFVAGVLLGRPGPNDVVGSSPSPQAPVASASSSPAGGACQPADVDARITLWEGAAGSRIADVELTNTGSKSCDLEVMAKPQLISGGGVILIQGSSPSGNGLITFAPGAVVKTLVRASNYCGPAAERWVSVAFVTSDGALFVATPLTPTDTTLPPCNGPGSAGTIEMQPWAR
ncbi:MAG TPA: DUF4232 domain-containing protein [Candidatus Limnocylindrales bacterium]|nr:DUF4232 domain-containing protein [Candidatus Limnocylindrales bacterium]